MDMNSLLAMVGPEPLLVPAAARDLRTVVDDPEIEIVEAGPASCRIRRVATPAPAAKGPAEALAEALLRSAVDHAKTVVVETDAKLKHRAFNKRGSAGNAEIRQALDALPLDGKTSLFLPGRSHNDTSTIVSKAQRRTGYRFTTHQTVKDGVAGVRVWRIGTKED